jgi:hypothetical protein
MHVVAHQHVRMQPAAEAQQSLAQALQITLPVTVIQETRQPVVAALHDVLRNPRKIETRKSGHATSIPMLRSRRHRRTPRRPSAQHPFPRQELSLAPLFSTELSDEGIHSFLGSAPGLWNEIGCTFCYA